MSEIEKIKRYIKRTNIPVSKASAYQMNMQEAFALSHQAYCGDFPLEMISLAFNYGQAKGYRAAKAEARKEAAV